MRNVEYYTLPLLREEKGTQISNEYNEIVKKMYFIFVLWLYPGQNGQVGWL